MPADQAEGLRRRRAGGVVRIVHGFFERPESAIGLAQALYVRGWSTLLVDTRARVWPESSARSLFGWREQIVRGRLLVQAEAFGGGWRAHGMRGDEPELADAVTGYDCVLLDMGPGVARWRPHPAVAPAIIVELNRSRASIREGYALAKAVTAHDSRGFVGLLGDRAACARVTEACERFLGLDSASRVCGIANGGDAFAALAVRMTGEETGPTACYKTGNT